MVEVERDKNWMVYSLPEKPSRELEANLKCLQDCAQSDKVFARDQAKLAQHQKNCCEPSAVVQRTTSKLSGHAKTKRLVHLRS
jgi:ArsR family transcriptional regulator